MEQDMKMIAHMLSFSAFVLLLIAWVITAPAFKLGDCVALRPRRIARRLESRFLLPRISRMTVHSIEI